MPTVPAPPAGATTIILNWHWACADPPPPIDVAGITVCTSCNIAISVRVGSPGNTGDVAQSIVASTVAAATNVAETIQAAFQTAIPPSVSPTAAPTPDPVAAVATPSSVVALAVTYRIDDGPLGAPVAPLDPGPSESEDLPRHGAPTSFGGGSAAQAAGFEQLQRRADLTLGVPMSAAAQARVASVRQWIVRRAVARSQTVARPARAQAIAPKPAPPAPPPSAPTPLILGAGVAATHSGGISVVTALASGLALVLLYAISTALRLPPAVPPARAAGANPHPPG